MARTRRIAEMPEQRKAIQMKGARFTSEEHLDHGPAEDTADLPLEQQADDAAALEGGKQSSAGPSNHDHQAKPERGMIVDPSSPLD